MKNAERSSTWMERLLFARRLPALSISLILLCSAVFWLWQWDDKTRYQDAAAWYSDSGLYALEAENYISHLAQTLQTDKSRQIEEWHHQGKVAAVAMAIVADRDFAYFMETTNGDFWGGSVYPKWRALRTELNGKTRYFSRFKWGLSGADKRPLTFFTHGFLSFNVWMWSVDVFMLLVLGALIETRIGGLSLLILFTGGTAITGLAGLVPHWHSATPMVGAAGGISVLLGVYLLQSGLQRRNLVFNVRYKNAPKRVVLPLYGAYWAIPWLIWIAVATSTWTLSATPAISGLLLGLACGWGLQKRMQTPVAAPTPSRPSDEVFRLAYDKALTRLSGFDFRGAEEALSTLWAQYPERGDVAERLFMLRHYRPHTEDHLTWAEALIDKLSHDTGNLQNIRHIVEQLGEKNGNSTLSPALLEKLLISATQAQHYEFAVSMAKAGIRQQCRSPLFIKGLRSLAQRLKAQDETAALHFEQMANDLSQPAQPVA